MKDQALSLAGRGGFRHICQKGKKICDSQRRIKTPWINAMQNLGVRERANKERQRTKSELEGQKEIRQCSKKKKKESHGE